MCLCGRHIVNLQLHKRVFILLTNGSLHNESYSWVEDSDRNDARSVRRTSEWESVREGQGDPKMEGA